MESLEETLRISSAIRNFILETEYYVELYALFRKHHISNLPSHPDLSNAIVSRFVNEYKEIDCKVQGLYQRMRATSDIPLLFQNDAFQRAWGDIGDLIASMRKDRKSYHTLLEPV